MWGRGTEVHGMDGRSRDLRRLVVYGLAAAGRGHVGPSMSPLEMLRVLYDDVLQVDPTNPDWPDRDRLIYSKGHGCLALYAILADKGFIDRELLATFCALDSPLGGHPERHLVPGVEFSTGALGHGLSVGVGIALGLRIRHRTPRVFVMTGDGELGEGSVWEAALAAAHHRLDTLTVLVDCNGVQSYASTDEVLGLEPLAAKWESFGFAAVSVDGHDVAELRAVLHRVPLQSGRPTAVICRTVKGMGLPFAEGEALWHYRSGIDAEQAAMMYAALSAPVAVPRA